MFTYFSLESRVPAQHPLRSIKAKADAVLGSMSGEFDRLYADTGRPSIAPERLLKASLPEFIDRATQLRRLFPEHG
jgi:transposase